MDIRPQEQFGYQRIPWLLRLFLLTNASLTAVCVVAELVCRKLGFQNSYIKPWYVGIKFNDFNTFYPRFQLLHHANFYTFDPQTAFAYPAPAALIYEAFYKLGGPLFDLRVFLVVSLGIILLAGVLYSRSLQRQGLAPSPANRFTAGALLLAFPFLFCFQRANIEIIVWLFLALGIWAFVSGREYSAAGCIGLAASIKFVPIIYLALFVSRRRYKPVFFGVLVAVAVMLLSLSFLGPTISGAWQGINLGLNAFQEDFVKNFAVDHVGFDHTVVGVYRRIFDPTPAFPTLLHDYTLGTALLGAALWLFRIRKLPFLNQVFCLVIAGIWLVPVSYEYTLMHLYVPLACLSTIAFGRDRMKDSQAAPFFVLGGMLTAPLTEFMWHGGTYGGQLQSGLLLVLFVLSLARPLRSQYDAWQTGSERIGDVPAEVVSSA
jgi:hypothetical protein